MSCDMHAPSPSSTGADGCTETCWPCATWSTGVWRPSASRCSSPVGNFVWTALSHTLGQSGTICRSARSGRMAKKASMPRTTDWFDSFARKTSLWCGKPVIFLGAVLIVVVWAATGPIFGFSDTWQLVINTGTTIVTFLMVFLIQNTQNRDALAVQVKLAELIIAVEGAHNKLANCEEMSEEELEQLHESYREQASIARQELDSRRDGKKTKPSRKKAMAES